MTRTIPEVPDLLRAAPVNSVGGVGVDRESNVIRGYVVAELGVFKDRRGEFIADSLQKIVELGNSKANGVGLRSRFQHPNSSDDGLGKHLGRARDFRLDGNKVRADLYFDKTALEAPVGGGKPLGLYVMDLAESDPGALSSSLVLYADKTYRTDPSTGKPLRDATGDTAPPIWIPTRLTASDVVDTGAAVNDFLGSKLEEIDLEHLGPQWGTLALDRFFTGQTRDVVESRMLSFLDRYLSHRFGEQEMSKNLAAGELLQAEPIVDEKLREEVSTLKSELLSLKEMLSKRYEEQDKAANSLRRSNEIAALCQMAKCADAAKYIADEKLSVENVRAILFEKLAAGTQFPTDDKGQGAGGNSDPDAKLKAEYAENRYRYERLGMTQDEFIRVRKEELGMVEQPDFMKLAAERVQKSLAGSAA